MAFDFQQRRAMGGGLPWRTSRWLTWLRVALGLAGLAVLVAIVRGVGVRILLDTLRPALLWLPVLCVIEVARVACETVGSYAAFGSLAPRIPRATLFRAHVIANGVGARARAARRRRGDDQGGAARAVRRRCGRDVGRLHQPGRDAPRRRAPVDPLRRGSLRRERLVSSAWASAIHAVAIGGSGLALQAAYARRRARSMARQARPLLRRPPDGRPRARALETAWGRRTDRGPPRSAFQTLQYGIAARAVGIDAGGVRASPRRA